MGCGFSRALRDVKQRNNRRLLILGLDNAGKTTVLNELAGKAHHTAPTLSFNVERVKVGKLGLQIWDVGGQDHLRPYWRHHYTGTQGLIYVVDSCDTDRMELAAAELATLCADEQLKGVPLLVLANKQDMSAAIHVDEVRERLELEKTCIGRMFQVQGCVAKTGQGIQEGITFLCSTMKKL